MKKQSKKIFAIRLLLVTFIAFIASIVFILFSPFSLQDRLYGENWLKVEKQEGERIWIDTSHWEAKKVWVEDGYYKEELKKEWVDTSYVVNGGYWKTEEYYVWVSSVTYVPYTAFRYIDTSHYEQRYRDVTKWVSCSLTIYVGCTSYGWSVYSFAAKPQGDVVILYKGDRYRAYKDVIDYRPYRGGRVYATRYRCYQKEVTVREYYYVWVKSGYWQPYTAYSLVDNSHWEKRTRKVWVDTSYKVTQGYWKEYKVKTWVDTSHYEYTMVWVKDGYYATPLHGEIVVEKEPKFIFTKWHKDASGNESGMKLKVSWKLDNSKLLPGEEEKKITHAYIYQDVCRYGNKGVQKVTIFKGGIPSLSEGSIYSITKFDYSGSEDSVLHIYLYGENGEVAHVYFTNPINGYRSINLGLGGTSQDANVWLGGNNYGKVKF